MMSLAEGPLPHSNSASRARIKYRRRAAKPDSSVGYLDQLPAVTLLQRLPVAVIAVAQDDTVVYANPACEAMLGYGSDELTGVPLSRLLVADATSPAGSAAKSPRAPVGTVTTWRHRRDGLIKVVVSNTTLLCADDPIVLLGLTEVTERLWNHGSREKGTSAVGPSDAA
jgi:PAS domain S-box-containing protein